MLINIFINQSQRPRFWLLYKQYIYWMYSVSRQYHSSFS